MKTVIAVLGLMLTAQCVGQTRNLADWKSLLLDKKDAAATRALCSSFTTSAVLAEQVEAEKCLANVAMFGANVVHLENTGNEGGVMYDDYIPEAVDEALQHLNRGIQLAPQDLSIHQGRLHVLEISRRYDQMAKALDESCTLYRGPGVPAAWLDYGNELNNLQQFATAVALMQVLDRHYPDNPDILGNIGAFLSMQKKDKEAITYLKRAVELAPKDAINTWDLGREYDYAGETALADQWYQKGMSLMTDAQQKKQSSCLYAEFVEKKLKNRARACILQKDSCEPGQATACEGVAGTNKHD